VSIDQRTLMQYFDGELDEAESAEVEAWLESDLEAERVLAGLEQISDVVRATVLERTQPPEGLTDRVMDHIARHSIEGPTNVVELHPAPTAGQDFGALRAPEEPHAWFRRAAPLAFATLAAAAAVALVLGRGHAPASHAPGAQAESSFVATSSPVVGPVPQPEVAAPPAEADVPEPEPAPSIAIESVDFGPREGTIFMLSEGEAATPVVWLMDEPAPPRDTMEPL
jgi:negative regulator of sigma E activity